MITLYHYPHSPCAAKVRGVLDEKGLAWEGRIVDLTAKKNLEPEYLKIHPKGLVPALVDGDKVLNDSTIIMEYLDTAYARDSLKPTDPYGQAQMRKWTKWIDETQHPNFGGIGWVILIRPSWLDKSQAETDSMLAKLMDPARRDRQKRLLEKGYAAPDYAQSMRVLDTTLRDMEKVLAKQPYLAGDRPSLADLAVLPYVGSMEKFGLEMMYRETRPAVTAWLERWQARPSYAAVMPWQLDTGHREEIRRMSAPIWAEIKAAA